MKKLVVGAMIVFVVLPLAACKTGGGSYDALLETYRKIESDGYVLPREGNIDELIDLNFVNSLGMHGSGNARMVYAFFDVNKDG